MWILITVAKQLTLECQLTQLGPFVLQYMDLASYSRENHYTQEGNNKGTSRDGGKSGFLKMSSNCSSSVVRSGMRENEERGVRGKKEEEMLLMLDDDMTRERE